MLKPQHALVCKLKWQRQKQNGKRKNYNYEILVPSYTFSLLKPQYINATLTQKRQFNMDLKRAKTSNVYIHTKRKAISRTKTDEQSIRHNTQ